MRKKKPTQRESHFGPTQKDIADALGVAQSTVATALSPLHEHKLFAETVERIRQYAAEVGYRPQRHAQIMRGGRTRIIGIIARVSVYVASHELLSRLANALNRAGYRLVLADPEWFGGLYESVRDYLLDQGVEGVVVCNIVTESESKMVEELLPATLPILSLNSSLENVPNLRLDTHGAFYHLTRYHLATGSRRLCLLSMFRDAGSLEHPAWTVRDRATGFAQAIGEAGGIVLANGAVREMMEIPCHENLEPGCEERIAGEILYVEREPEITNAYEHGYRQASRLIVRDALPDSLICMNDDCALGALAACVDHGIEVPEALKLSGYDDTSAGRFGAVPLTTVWSPLEVLAQQAAVKIMELIQHPEKRRTARMEYVPCKIVIRRSGGRSEEIERLAEDGFFNAPVTGACFEWLPSQEREHRFAVKADVRV